MKQKQTMRTRVEFTNNGDSQRLHYISFTVIADNAEELFYSFENFAEGYGFTSTGCPDELEGEFCDTFYDTQHQTKKEFMSDFRSCVRDWKKTL